jgi:hypothetical protein
VLSVYSQLSQLTKGSRVNKAVWHAMPQATPVVLLVRQEALCECGGGVGGWEGGREAGGPTSRWKVLRYGLPDV